MCTAQPAFHLRSGETVHEGDKTLLGQTLLILMKEMMTRTEGEQETSVNLRQRYLRRVPSVLLQAFQVKRDGTRNY